jgi:hypothetical protein
MTAKVSGVGAESVALSRELDTESSVRVSVVCRSPCDEVQNGNSAPGRLQIESPARNLRHGSTTGIDKFQNCIPAAGKVRSGLTGTDIHRRHLSASAGMAANRFPQGRFV